MFLSDKWANKLFISYNIIWSRRNLFKGNKVQSAGDTALSASGY
jgi:hypothetical protein